MFEAAVDGFGKAACGVGVFEVGQDMPGSACKCPVQRNELGYAARNARIEVGVLISACIRTLPARVSGTL